MADLLRGFGIGIVNLLGVAIPGALLLGLAVFGLAAPSLVLALDLTGAPVRETWPEAIAWVALAGFVGLSYVAGYILRLKSPNELDRASVKRREQSAPPNEGDEAKARRLRTQSRVRFPINDDDHFPYLGLKDYLGELGGQNLMASLVTWDSDNHMHCDTTHINTWKKDVELFCPPLASGVRSEEAHVRLMAGTWLAIKTAWRLVCSGIALSMVALAASLILSAERLPRLVEDRPFFAVYGALAGFLLLGMWWAKRSIEQLFHPRRVGELLLVLHAKVHADRIAMSSGKDNKEE